MLLTSALRREAREAPVSDLEAVSNYGREKPGLIPMWSGESDLTTPDFIRDAAHKSLAAGETFYTWQAGLPELRQALSDYHLRHFGKKIDAEEFVVTSGGMHAITLALQATSGHGDEALYLSPAWPNFAGAAGLAGVLPVPVPLVEDDLGWHCDIERLEAAITPRTRSIFFNSPSNPTGWTADVDTLRAIQALARKHGLWIIADEVYSLFHFDGNRAPSFMDIQDPADQIIYVNTFSKNWAMTGWRVGWMRGNTELSRTFENLIQYSSSGVAEFLQRGAISALEHGDGFLKEQITHAEVARDMACRILGESNRVRFSMPTGAFYLFFQVEGVKDSNRAVFDIVDKANIGLAPGRGFGAAGEGYLRMCFQRSLGQVEEACDRLYHWIAHNS
ncbi:pyridoxal phosphate-dependent aminotransferase [Phyllobacterium sp. UNC302MFCol5.2]|uniref:pyridoxal phosphate-dependent aminotransferase n=1 Tax=Phyllobacterium sp. UNC302MFCol5.2 TaxID=1449065 RepID=UPI000489AE7B|nr:pyridoxal phosphate-dependent aminotransferase [Phyllobacterium sp. UNC302MFCol5.2]